MSSPPWPASASIARTIATSSKEQAGVDKEDFRNLELAWALAYPNATTVRAQPAVVGNTLFVPVAEAPQMVALDVSGAKPCVKWVYRTDLPLRTGVGYGSQPGGRKVVVFADVAAQVTMLDAATGKFLWRTRVGMWGPVEHHRHAADLPQSRVRAAVRIRDQRRRG